MVMRTLCLLLMVILLLPSEVYAADFSMEANDFAAVLLKNTISNMRREKRFERWRRALECWNRFCRMFVFYFNVVRGCY